MAEIEAPSFDLNFDSPSPPQEIPKSTATLGSSSYQAVEDDVDELRLVVSDSGTESESAPPSRVFKRLRKGPLVGNCSSDNKRESVVLDCDDGGDDDIEEFSSPEDLTKDTPASAQYQSVCGSSKIPLRVPGVLTSKSSNQCKARKKEQSLEAPVSAGSGTRLSGSLFPELTISPLRKFQLLDSDSDDPPITKSARGVTKNNDLNLNKRQCVASEQKRKSVTPLIKDLWENFCVKTTPIATPALDDVCEEYFQKMKGKEVSQKPDGGCASETKRASSFQNVEQPQDDDDKHRPPAHSYFLHTDPRIQSLVRSRFPNFVPLGVDSNSEGRQSVSLIDYMGQFDCSNTSKQDASRSANSKGSSRGAKKAKGPVVSEGWVNTKTSATIPKDAGKRRVCADDRSAGPSTGPSSGHWYTGSDGKKVYVSGNGQELTGRAAYRHYRKESGKAFRKPRKEPKKSKKRKA